MDIFVVCGFVGFFPPFFLVFCFGWIFLFCFIGVFSVCLVFEGFFSLFVWFQEQSLCFCEVMWRKQYGKRNISKLSLPGVTFEMAVISS